MHCFRCVIGALVCVGLVAPLTRGAAQQPPISVRGVAFDSLRGTPLAEALVSIVGTARNTTTDGHGRFRFDSVSPGAHTFAVQHAALDSIGFTGVASRANVTDGRDEIHVTVPSFASLWKSVCRGPVPKDSGFVYGTVKDAVSGEAIRGATIEVSWLDVSVQNRTNIQQTSYRGQSRSDSNGGYSICGLPTDLTMRARASTDSSVSGLIDLVGRGARVQRRDFFVVAVDSATVRARGTIAGVVTDTAGRPFAGARVVMDEAAEIRSGDDGRFMIPNVPAGTRQVEVLAIGMSPVVTTVDVMPNETATFSAALRRITTLEAVKVTGSRRQVLTLTEFEERRKLGAGYIRDSTQIAATSTMSSVFTEFPSVNIERGANASSFSLSLPGGARGRCAASVWIDGIYQQDSDALTFMRPNEIAAIEVYPRAFSTPSKFMRNDLCGVVVVWTKRGFQ